MEVYNPFTGKYYSLKPYRRTKKPHKPKNLWKEPKAKKSIWDIIEGCKK